MKYFWGIKIKEKDVISRACSTHIEMEKRDDGARAQEAAARDETTQASLSLRDAGAGGS